jgi:hypothetical protein
VKIPIEAMACPHRFVADTARGRRLIERLLIELGEGAGFESLTAHANAAGGMSNAECRMPIEGQIPNAKYPVAQTGTSEPWPRELEVELTTERPLADSLRPCL